MKQINMKQINKRRLGAILAWALVMSACAGSAPALREAEHNSRNSLDWAGTYAGLIPSAGGMGIVVRLTLNEDGTYALHYHYVGRQDPDFRSTGNFTWDNAGSVITLDLDSSGSRHYRVGENMLLQLDLEGREITGELAQMYVLRKE